MDAIAALVNTSPSIGIGGSDIAKLAELEVLALPWLTAVELLELFSFATDRLGGHCSCLPFAGNDAACSDTTVAVVSSGYRIA